MLGLIDHCRLKLFVWKPCLEDIPHAGGDGLEDVGVGHDDAQVHVDG